MRLVLFQVASSLRSVDVTVTVTVTVTKSALEAMIEAHFSNSQIHSDLSLGVEPGPDKLSAE